MRIVPDNDRAARAADIWKFLLRLVTAFIPASRTEPKSACVTPANDIRPVRRVARRRRLCQNPLRLRVVPVTPSANRSLDNARKQLAAVMGKVIADQILAESTQTRNDVRGGAL